MQFAFLISKSCGQFESRGSVLSDKQKIQNLWSINVALQIKLSFASKISFSKCD